MQLVLFDTIERGYLYPFAEIRPVAELRIGMLTIKERWEYYLQQQAVILSDDYLSSKFAVPASDSYLYADARIMISKGLIHQIKELKDEEALIYENQVLAVKTHQPLTYGFSIKDCKHTRFIHYTGKVTLLRNAFEISKHNAVLIEEDLALIKGIRNSAPIPVSNSVVAPENIFIEEGAVVENCFLNASGGSIYIGKNSLVMEGCMIRGPFALLEKGVVKMGAKIYGATTAGKQCVIGGEIKNTVFFDYSNKAHDGYLGDAVIGSWCNIGAGTSCSNLKNTAGAVKIWNKPFHQWMDAGTKCGVLMGDYSRTAINTSLNTGTVTGIGCNLLGNGLLPKFIPDFTWNTATGEKYVAEKVMKDLNNWMQLKQHRLTETDQQILLSLYSKQL
jgi:UDP-N-acetylglucosamine diphosphorylase / glucose-1-phosphate thymidylyltransferase / UDP-N-acetylgalactosamine diphosphorylase / glucosamine-1-phosphate N-acetyltransferase / galactosamine-1-phosphate N-acetyltransferase